MTGVATELISNSLLPPSAGSIERALELVWQRRLNAIERDLSDLWNPDTCRADLLPYLAWALSVDEWQDEWPESVRRDVILRSIAVHRHKGTRGALNVALTALGYETTVKEWFETGGEPYTFSVTLDIYQQPVLTHELNNIAATINASKNARSHFDIARNVHSACGIYHGGYCASTLSCAVSAYTPKSAESNCSIYPVLMAISTTKVHLKECVV